MQALTLKTLYDFKGKPDGQYPGDAVAISGTTIYGITVGGGTEDFGTAFKLDVKTGQEKLLYSFVAGADGCYPDAGVICVSGTLCGTTYECGNTAGTLLSVNATTGAELVLHGFSGPPDGNAPGAGLTVNGDTLYGTTMAGGYGAIYQHSISSASKQILYSFRGQADGGRPTGGALLYTPASFMEMASRRHFTISVMARMGRRQRLSWRLTKVISTAQP
jgi:uncharacterized repeat protein (TIGR03803 family)